MLKLVIDTDPGVDDAHALMTALAHSDARVEAITTVAGNVSLERTTANACTVLDVMGVSDCAGVPLYAGCSRPLVSPPSDAGHVHGQDGLGDTHLSPSTREVVDEHAVNALIRLADESPGELTLLAIGPLTNVALATRLDPDLPHKYRSLVVMGGAIYGRGNVTPATEFNIHTDPEAAAIVFDTWPGLTLLSWETTLAHPFDSGRVRELLDIESPRAEFFRRISYNTLAYLERLLGERIMLEPDLLAAAVALEPDIVVKAEMHHVAIELTGARTRGQTVVDWSDLSGGSPNVNLVLELDTGRVWEMLRAALAEGPS